MESSQFSDSRSPFESIEQIDAHGATCDTFRVKLYGKLHFLKRLKPAYTGDVRYQEALRKEFEAGYRLEHPNIVRYISLSDEGVLMEYVDGETLSDRLHKHPDDFSRQNTDKFLRQLLAAVGYLHAHQVLHLDLKSDNIMITRIGNDLKLVDLGCCRTDTFVDTQGYTNAFAAPEQRSGGEVDERTDIYAIGKILELLPNRHIYNKVIARCTADNPAERYQTVGQLQHALFSRKHPYLVLLIVSVLMVLAVVAFYLLSYPAQPSQAPKGVDTIVRVVREQPVAAQFGQKQEQPVDTLPLQRQKQPASPSRQTDELAAFKTEIDKLMDEAYRSTIATFCDSVFPSQSVGRHWQARTTAFHHRTIEIGDRLVKKHPQVAESAIRQEIEEKFQHLVSYVFNQMRANGQP